MSAAVITHGSLNLDRLSVNECNVRSLVRNPLATLRLGGKTTTNAATSLLSIESKTDGVHLKEYGNSVLFLDSVVHCSTDLSVAGAFQLGQGLTLGGDLSVVGDTGLNTLTVNGAAEFGDTVVTAGQVTAASLSVPGTTTLGVTSAGDTTLNSASVASTLAVTGASTFAGEVTANAGLAASAVTVSGATAPAGTLSVQQALTAVSGVSVGGALSVAGASTLAYASVTGALQVGGASAFTGAITASGAANVQGKLTASSAQGLAVTAGPLAIVGSSLEYDSAAGSENLAIKMGATSAIKIHTDSSTEFLGGVKADSITAHAGQVLTLGGGDSAQTVRILGKLVLDQSIDQRDVTKLSVSDLTIRVGVTKDASNNEVSTDLGSDSAGMEIAGDSSYAKSIRWFYNQGLEYKPSDASHFTGDGLSYWTVAGGNLNVQRTIPAANHQVYDADAGTFAEDNTAATVSYSFRINDQEQLEIVKTQGIDYSVNSSTAIGSEGRVIAVYDLS